VRACHLLDAAPSRWDQNESNENTRCQGERARDIFLPRREASSPSILRNASSWDCVGQPRTMRLVSRALCSLMRNSIWLSCRS
jgi:hypothetical protein